MDMLQGLIANNIVRILSGDGENNPTMEIFSGRPTLRAIRQRLKKYRYKSGWWARAEVFSHVSYGKDVWVDVETGSYYIN